MSGSLRAGLRPAAEYLALYPHGCFEQRSSKMISLLLAQDSDGVDSDVIERELDWWADFQLESGAFPFWPEVPGFWRNPQPQQSSRDCERPWINNWWERESESYFW